MAGLAEEGADEVVGAGEGALPSGAELGGTRLASTQVDFESYDPGDLQAIDKAIRHMPGVVAYAVRMAEECISRTGSEDNFAVVLQNEPNTQRPRAYAAPNTSQGIHLELSDSVLLKSAISMEGFSLQ